MKINNELDIKRDYKNMGRMIAILEIIAEGCENPQGEARKLLAGMPEYKMDKGAINNG